MASRLCGFLKYFARRREESEFDRVRCPIMMYCNRIIGVTEFAMWTANLWVNAVLTQKQQEKFLKLLRVTVRVVGYRFNAKTTFSSHRAHNVVNGTRLDTGSRRPTTVNVIYCTLKCLLSEKLEKI